MTAVSIDEPNQLALREHTMSPPNLHNPAFNHDFRLRPPPAEYMSPTELGRSRRSARKANSRKWRKSHRGALVKDQRRRGVIQSASATTEAGANVDSELDYCVGRERGRGRDERDMRAREWAVKSS